jgi:hypothetical protein
MNLELTQIFSNYAIKSIISWIQVRSATLINESKKAEDALVSKVF